MKSKYLGLKIKMNNRMYATCIVFRSTQDIDVQFEDGTIVRHKRKSKFLRGFIGYPKNN